MIDFKPKRKLKLKPATPLSGLLSNSAVRFTVAGFCSLLVTLLLFIFMNYLLGNFDKYAQNITQDLFSLHMVKLDKKSGTDTQTDAGKQRSHLPPKPPAQVQTQTNDKSVTNKQRRQMMIEMLLGKREASDNSDGKDQNLSNPR